ncbi:MAG: folate-binding protein YgfZ [Rhizobiaceae bacterium]|nr:folate-binding protein YgfZ [Rhizobiaceae bacterium]
MPTVHLTDRALISIAGPDAEHFLQNIVTTNIEGMAADEAWPGALLTPQGKILFDFLISRRGADGFLLECRGDSADDFMRRLTLYKLRSKLEITKLDQTVVAVAWQDDSAGSQIDSDPSQTDSTVVRDRRFPEAADVTRSYRDLPAATANEDAYAALRIVHGVAESGEDYALGDAFPHDILFDQNGGVGLKKGCFVGQEVVSRMHHRGTARRRLLIAESDTALPAPGSDITADGRPVGTLGTVVGTNGLAIARIGKVKAAMDSGTPLLAGGTALTLAIPAWAKFGFPESSAGAEAD